jgi:hypothetical protein
LGYCGALAGIAPKKLGRSSGPVERYRQDLKDFARWDELFHLRLKQEELRENVELIRSRGGALNGTHEEEKYLTWIGHSWERAYECASMLLRGTPAFGGPDAMKSSYLRVQLNNRKQTRPLRYHVFDSEFLAKIGIEHPSLWGRGKKVIPFYNLTL